ncbi:MAG: hypothetical protein J5850_00440 [Clostridia bacterium]|nr:hypothetical protein [Clostridia bacterium]
MKAETKDKIKKIFQFFLNPKLLLCLGIAWFITNGWSYVMFGFGTYYKVGWMIAVSSAYLTFLWLPISPEKIVTVAIAIFLLKLIFPNDKKTLAVLYGMREKIKETLRQRKEKRKNKKNSKENEDN